MIAARVLTIDVETIRQSAAGPIGWVVSWSGVTDKGFYYTVAEGYRLRKDAYCAFSSSAALMATDEVTLISKGLVTRYLMVVGQCCTSYLMVVGQELAVCISCVRKFIAHFCLLPL